MTKLNKHTIIYILIITNLISMLNLSDSYFEDTDDDSGQSETDSGQPDQTTEPPKWSDYPDTHIQIVDISQNPDDSKLPPPDISDRLFRKITRQPKKTAPDYGAN